MRFQWVAQSAFAVDAVVVAPSLPMAFEDTGSDQLGENALDGPFGDPDRFREVANPGLGVGVECHQHVGVIREVGETGTSGMAGVFHARNS